MIQIYSPENLDFESNGDMTLFPEECKIKAELNGEWILEIDHPLDEEGRWRYIEEEAVLKVPSFLPKEQLFRISKPVKDNFGVTATAYPIFFDAAKDCFLMDVRPTNANGQEALTAMCAPNAKYSAISDIAKKTTSYYVRKNLLKAISGDDENSFLNRWGGEIIYNNYTISINERAGSDNGFQVRYGKNMNGMTQTIDMSNVITRIVPVAYNGRMLEGDAPWVDSPNINKYPTIYYREIKFEDVKLQEDVSGNESGFATLEELRDELVKRCELMFEKGCDQPAITLDVKMIDLSGTEEYKDFSDLEKVSLGDDVHCYNKRLDITTKARCIQIIYDCIRKRVDGVVLGDYVPTVFDKTTCIINKVNAAIKDDGTVIAERVRGFLDAAETSLKLQSSATRKVDGRAFSIEDSDPESPLYGIMEAGTQGLRISKEKDTQGNWIWKTAMTAAGIIADTIVAGLLSDRIGNNKWDLEQGILEATNLAVQETISTGTLYCDKISNAAYPVTLTSNRTIYVNASTGDDEQECINGAVFKTLQGAVNSIPKFMNGRTVYIELQTDLTENVSIRYFSSGRIYIYLAGHTIYGYIYGIICPQLYIYGGTKDGSGTDAIGIIHPSKGVNIGEYTTSIGLSYSTSAYISNLEIFGADNLVDDTENRAAVAVQHSGTMYAINIKITNVESGFRANAGGRLYSSSSSGIASKYGFHATSGGYIAIGSNTQAGGTTNNTYESYGGQVYLHSPTFETGSASTSSSTASTTKTNKTATYTSSKGNAIQYYGSSSAKWRSDNTPKVGTWGYGDHVAYWFFGDNFVNIADKEVYQVDITFTRNSGGYSAATPHDFYVHSYESQPSTTSPTKGVQIIDGVEVITENSKTIKITDSTYIDEIKKAKGICSYPPSQSKTYYSVMSGAMKVKFYYTE